MKKWFSTVNTPTLCRGGSNGPYHPSQLQGLSLVDYGESLLDIGCGSGTTLECILKRFSFKNIQYKGVDFIEKHVIWCVSNFPKYWFSVENAMDLSFGDNSFDVVWSRHVVDHLPSFEKALDEQLRVAKKKVICILWYPLSDKNEHIIKNIEYDNKIYKDEYLNTYSRKRVLKYLENKYPEWIPAIKEKVGFENKKTDTIIYLRKNNG